MKISSEFSKYAQDYNSYNIIQNSVIEKLLSHVKRKPQNILDLGCGNGNLCREISWEYKNFTGVDFAEGMLNMHPKSDAIKCIYGDFNNQKLFDDLSKNDYDYIISASALQWAEDLDMVFKNIKEMNVPFAFAIFTSNTFKTLNETANISSMLRSADELKEIAERYFETEIELVNYKLEFESTRDMFRYIKKSGVSGARRVLNYKESKKLLQDYPVNYLEFEVAFIYSKSH